MCVCVGVWCFTLSECHHVLLHGSFPLETTVGRLHMLQSSIQCIECLDTVKNHPPE